MEENTNVVNTSTTQEKEGSKFGWGVLGFFIPLVGLILFLVWMKDKKKASKAAGIGALIGFIFSIISTVLLITFFGAILGIGLFEYDNYNDNYNKTPIVEENTKNEEDDVDEIKDSCNLKPEKESKYEYKVSLDGKCNEYIIKDNNKELFKINTNIKDYGTSYQLIINGDSIDIYGLNNNRYDVNEKKMVFSDIDFEYYMINDLLIFDLKYSDPSSRNVYIYDLKNNNYIKIDKDLGNNDLPKVVRDVNIDERENIIVTVGLQSSSGFEGMRDDPRVQILMKVIHKEAFDIDAELSNFGIGDFPYEQGYYYRDASSSKPYDVKVTKTIKEYYNEIMKED